MTNKNKIVIPAPKVKLCHGHTREVVALALSPDGAVLASGGRNKCIRLWNTTTGAPIGGPLAGHLRRNIHSLAFSPDGKILACGSIKDDPALRFLNPITGEQIGSLSAKYQGTVRSLVWSRDGTALYSSGCGDHTVRCWRMGRYVWSGEIVYTADHRCFELSLSPDGSLLALTLDVNVVVLLNTRNNENVHTFRVLNPIPRWVIPAVFSPKGNVLAVGASDNSVIVWDVSTKQQLWRKRISHSGFDHGILSIAWSQNGRMLVVGGCQHSLTFLDAGTGDIIHQPPGDFDRRIWGLITDASSQRLFISTNDRSKTAAGALSILDFGKPNFGTESDNPFDIPVEEWEVVGEAPIDS